MAIQCMGADTCQKLLPVLDTGTANLALVPQGANLTLNGLSPREIEKKQKELLDEVPDVGSIGNKALRGKLGADWSQDLYWAIRNKLIELGQLETGKGKGGSVKKVPTTVPAQQNTEAPSPVTSTTDHAAEQPATADYSKELDLYQPISTVLRNQWAKAQGFDTYLVEVTAKQGSRQTGGKWSRPDVTVVGYKTFPYLPGRFLEVVSFEVKPTNAIDVSAVYEALAHRRAATHSHVVVHIPSSLRDEIEDALEAVTEEAKKLGIGVVVADDPADFDTWEILLEADRFDPDPGKLNEFIAQQTTLQLKDQILRWFK